MFLLFMYNFIFSINIYGEYINIYGQYIIGANIDGWNGGVQVDGRRNERTAKKKFQGKVTNVVYGKQRHIMVIRASTTKLTHPKKREGREETNLSTWVLLSEKIVV